MHQTFVADYMAKDEEIFDRPQKLLKKLSIVVFVLSGVFLRNGDRDVYNVRMEGPVFLVGIHTTITRVSDTR